MINQADIKSAGGVAPRVRTQAPKNSPGGYTLNARSSTSALIDCSNSLSDCLPFVAVSFIDRERVNALARPRSRCPVRQSRTFATDAGLFVSSTSSIQSISWPPSRQVPADLRAASEETLAGRRRIRPPAWLRARRLRLLSAAPRRFGFRRMVAKRPSDGCAMLMRLAWRLRLGPGALVKEIKGRTEVPPVTPRSTASPVELTGRALNPKPSGRIPLTPRRWSLRQGFPPRSHDCRRGSIH